MEYRNPKYNADGSIDVDVLHPKYGWIPFTAHPEDCEAHGRKLYRRLKEAAEAEEIEVAPHEPPSDEEVAQMVRAERNSLLQASDWTQLPDVPEETRDAWAVYRQALRDITGQTGFPREVLWPSPPT